MSANVQSPYASPMYASPDNNDCRDVVWLNGEWDFAPQSEYAMPKPEEWSEAKIRIPSPWNVNAFSKGNGPGGDFTAFVDYPKEWDRARYGWHKRSFDLTERETKDRRIILHFEAVMYEAEVYVNGEFVGRHGDGFLPFDFDVTDVVKAGSNEILVGVRNADHLKYNGRATHPTGSFWGGEIRGIWQDVYLRILPEVYVADTYVTTSVREKKINVETTITNASASDQTVTVNYKVKSPGGIDKSAPSVASQQVSVKAGETKVIKTSTAWESPRLWSPDSPFLYFFETKLDGNQPDQSCVRFGFREFWIEGSQFILNGKPIRMRADAWHFMGVPQMTEMYARRWYEVAKATHVTIIRLHAQVYPRFYYDIADEMGMLLVDENANWASHCNYQYNDDFWARSTRHTEDWVKRNRNHPSVVIWSVDNEFLGAHHVQPNDGAPSIDWLFEKTSEHLVAAIRRYDQTRPISADGDGDHGGRLPIASYHYPGLEAPGDAPPNKPLTLGEVGPMYYSLPDAEARFIGDHVYESFNNRMNAIGVEMSWLTQHHRKWTEYTSPFNLAWYGLEPMPFSGEQWTYSTLESPGMKPDRVGPYTSTFNCGFDDKNPKWKPNALYPYLQDSYIPQRFFFDDRNTRFYSGDRVKRQITVHNDGFNPTDITVKIDVISAGNNLLSETKKLKMNSAAREIVNISFTAPPVAARTAVDIQVTLSEGGKELFRQTQKCDVFPHDSTGPAVTVLGGSQLTLRRLTNAGLQVTSISDVADARNDQPLLIPAGVRVNAKDKETLMSQVDAGLRAVFFGDIPWSEVGCKAKRVSEERAFPADWNHPIFKGLGLTDLQLWADGERVVYRTYLPTLPPNSRALMFSGNGEPAIYEQRHGKGWVIGCGADIAKLSDEPAARTLLVNMIDWAAKAPDASKATAKTVYLGSPDSPIRSTMAYLGADCSDNPADIRNAQLLIIDGGEPNLDSMKTDDLRKFAQAGGKVLVWGLDTESVSKFNQTFGLSVIIEDAARDVLVKADRGVGAARRDVSVPTNGLTLVEGVVETGAGGSLYLRQDNLHPSPADVVIPAPLARKLNLKAGEVVTGWAEAPTISRSNFSLVRVDCVNRENQADPLLVGVNNADLYWIERGSVAKVVDYSVEVEGGQALIKSPPINWRGWTEEGENTKTSAVVKSEANPPAAANALVRLPYGQGEIIFSQLSARATKDKSRRVASALLENLGVPMDTEKIQAPEIDVDEEGYIKTWLVAGPYSKAGVGGNDLDYAWLADEAQLLPQEGELWAKHINIATHHIDFGELFPVTVESAAYAAVYVWSPKSSEVLLDTPDVLKADLRIGSDDGVKVWLNGEEIWNNPAFRPAYPDADIIRDVKIKQGWNLLLVKVGNGSGDWGVIARFTSPNGRPIRELKYSVAVPEELRK